MGNMKKYLLFLATILCTNLVAQNSPSVAVVQMQSNRLKEINSKSFDFPTFSLKETEIKGFRYFYDEYTEGELWLTDNRHYKEGYLFKFDEVENSVQVKSPDGKELLLDKDEVVICQLFIFGSTVSYLGLELPNKDNQDKENTYNIFQVLYLSDNYQVLKLPQKRIRKNPKNMSAGQGFEYDQYVPEYHYFVKKKDGLLTEFKPNKKDILAQFSEKKGNLEPLFKQAKYKKLSDALLAELISTVDK
jgi:hypothetical protein